MPLPQSNRPIASRWLTAIRSRWTEIEALLWVVSVRGLGLLTSAVTGLILPLTLSKAGFATYREMMLYMGYYGFLHLGLVDGLYLQTTGTRLGDLDGRLVSRSLIGMLALHLLTMPIGLLILGHLMPHWSSLFFAVVAIAWLLQNMVSLASLLHLATASFRHYGSVSMISGLGSTGLVALLWWQRVQQPLPYLIPFLIANGVSAVALLRTLPWISPGGVAQVLTSVRRSLGDGIQVFGGSISLSLANTAGAVAASLLLDPESFADYAFAMSFTALALGFLDGIATATVPFLAQRLRIESSARDLSASGLALLLWLLPASYWPIRFLVERLYPQFAPAMPILFIMSCGLPASALARSRIIPLLKASQEAGKLLLFGLLALFCTVLPIVMAMAGVAVISGRIIATAWVVGIGLASLAGMLTMRSFHVQAFTRLDITLSIQALAAVACFVGLSRIAPPSIAFPAYGAICLVIVALILSPGASRRGGALWKDGRP